MKAIQFKNVHFSYDDAGDGDIFASEAFSLRGIDFSVEEGEFVAVLGHNGSGKSTLARLSNALLLPSSGEVLAFGLDTSKSENEFAIREQVGIVFQNPDNQTVASIVEDDVAFGPENVGIAREEIGKRIEFALNAVGMQDYRHATVSRLSGGQKQRIAIAGVLALKPKVMILDESTAMLDPKGRKEVMDVVYKLNKEEKITVIIITHFPEEALLADRAIVMHQGKIVMEGKPRDVLSDETALTKCSLALPKSLELCRRLQEQGFAIPDCWEVETLANALAPCLKNIQPTQEDKETQLANDTGIIVCENLHYTYEGGSAFASHALNGMDVTVNEGDFFGVIGHTGSGKSTFVQHLNALIKLPTAEKKYKEKRRKKGDVLAETVLRVGEFDLTKKTTDFTALRRNVGMVFQYPEYQLFAETVFEDVAFGLKNFCKGFTQAQVEEAVQEALQTVGLNYAEIKDKSPFDLSGGQRRRVAIAGVIVTKPEILILDEPSAGLDPLGKKEIMSLLNSLRKSWCKTVIIVSHDMDEVAENCTRVALLSKGKALTVTTPNELFSTQFAENEGGLDVPFIAKLSHALCARGINVQSRLTLASFVQALSAMRKGIAGTRGGAKDE